jgi:hypothetical protein
VTARWSKKEGKSYPIIDKMSPFTGWIACLEGQSTGETCGEIKSESVTGSVEGTMVEKLARTEFPPEAESKKGDSGGPFL